MSNQQYITAVNPVQEPEREKGGRDGANEHVACCLVTVACLNPILQRDKVERSWRVGGMDGGGRWRSEETEREGERGGEQQEQR